MLRFLVLLEGAVGGWPGGIDASVPMVAAVNPVHVVQHHAPGGGVGELVNFDGKNPKDGRGTNMSGFTTTDRNKAHQGPQGQGGSQGQGSKGKGQGSQDKDGNRGAQLNYDGSYI